MQNEIPFWRPAFVSVLGLFLMLSAHAAYELNLSAWRVQPAKDDPQLYSLELAHGVKDQATGAQHESAGGRRPAAMVGFFETRSALTAPVNGRWGA